MKEVKLIDNLYISYKHWPRIHMQSMTVRFSGLKCQMRIKSFNYIHKMTLVIMLIVLNTNYIEFL